mmetsp:Transcript_7395/g.13348  ORF Transcript_7395/g.13348 Transcript_7395/m.13348 type:complete len:114 (-) Transcript_7395:115-456(-)
MAFVSAASVFVSGVSSGRAVCVSSQRAAVAKRGSVLMMAAPDLQERIKAAMAEAEAASAKFGKSSKEAANAWDTVEELEAEASHQKASTVKKDPLEEYCEDSPEADECRTYDN